MLLIMSYDSSSTKTDDEVLLFSLFGLYFGLATLALCIGFIVQLRIPYSLSSLPFPLGTKAFSVFFFFYFFFFFLSLHFYSFEFSPNLTATFPPLSSLFSFSSFLSLLSPLSLFSLSLFSLSLSLLSLLSLSSLSLSPLSRIVHHRNNLCTRITRKSDSNVCRSTAAPSKYWIC